MNRSLIVLIRCHPYLSKQEPSLALKTSSSEQFFVAEKGKTFFIEIEVRREVGLLLHFSLSVTNWDLEELRSSFKA